MISYSTKKYIKSKAIKSGTIIPDNYEDILNGYCSIVANFGHKLAFKKSSTLKNYKIGASAGPFKKSAIVVTPEWASRLVLINTGEVHNAFKITIGHELTHKDGDIFVLKHGIRCVKFLAHVNEVHADFGAAQKMNLGRNILIKSMEYKKSFADNDKSDCSHPSWERRKFYAKNFDFTKKLIQQIAKDTGCKNKKAVREACAHYNDIRLG